MLGFAATGSIFAYSDPVDFRKQHDGLYAIVRQELGRNPLDGSLYIFFNRRRDRVKILVWDRNGFWLFYKRLEKGTFQVLRKLGDPAVSITRAELSMLLDGLNLQMAKKRGNFSDEVRIL